MDELRGVGAAIRAARKEAGLTQKQLAELVELGERTVREIERGAEGPSIGAVLRTANAVGLCVTTSTSRP